MSDLVKYKVFFCKDAYYASVSSEEIAGFDFRETTREELEEFKKDVDFYNETRRDAEPFAILFVEAGPLDIQTLMTETRARRLESLRRPKQDWPNFVDLVNPTGPAE